MKAILGLLIVLETVNCAQLSLKDARIDDLERAQYARAVQFRKMTDAQICEYLDGLLEREREARRMKSI